MLYLEWRSIIRVCFATDWMNDHFACKCISVQTWTERSRIGARGRRNECESRNTRDRVASDQAEGGLHATRRGEGNSWRNGWIQAMETCDVLWIVSMQTEAFTQEDARGHVGERWVHPGKTDLPYALNWRSSWWACLSWSCCARASPKLPLWGTTKSVMHQYTDSKKSVMQQYTALLECGFCIQSCTVASLELLLKGMMKSAMQNTLFYNPWAFVSDFALESLELILKGTIKSTRLHSKEFSPMREKILLTILLPKSTNRSQQNFSTVHTSTTMRNFHASGRVDSIEIVNLPGCRNESIRTVNSGSMQEIFFTSQCSDWMKLYSGQETHRSILNWRSGPETA